MQAKVVRIRMRTIGTAIFPGESVWRIMTRSPRMLTRTTIARPVEEIAPVAAKAIGNDAAVVNDVNTANAVEAVKQNVVAAAVTLRRGNTVAPIRYTAIDPRAVVALVGREEVARRSAAPDLINLREVVKVTGRTVQVGVEKAIVAGTPTVVGRANGRTDRPVMCRVADTRMVVTIGVTMPMEVTVDSQAVVAIVIGTSTKMCPFLQQSLKNPVSVRVDV
mmetsp:Transcript_34231/g.74101  ORF Transcript_34231/g.74101 Transcript_34231/m.74101 type:complete len:220 (-) Transcript_34231:3217-3876(-)